MKDFYLKFKTQLWLVISGLLTSLPLIFTELGFLQWISIVPMACILMQKISDESIKKRKLYLYGVLFFWGYYSLSFHWFFYMYPLDFTGISNAASLAVVVLACFGLGLFQAVQSALMFVIFGMIGKTEAAEKYKIIKPFCAAALWVILEWWQTVGWWGVPWARLPLGQIDATIFVRSASLFGSYFITFVIVSVNFCLALVIKEKSMRHICAFTALSLFCLNLALGAIVTLTYKDQGERISFSAAQGNISSNEKWNSGSNGKILRTYRELTEEAAEKGAKYIVWPETTIPYILFDYPSIAEYVSSIAKDNDITIFLSTFTENKESGELRNSIMELKPDGSYGEVMYSKQRLVPFGEFVPMRELVGFIFPPLADIGMLEVDLTPGEDSVVLETESGIVGCGLCFDSIYENVIIESVRNGAEIIIISTNDSWFSDSAALDMHNSQSRLRAIECGRYLVRSANTGISSVIDPMGNVKDKLGALEKGQITADVSMRQERTLYSYIGNIFVYACMAYISLILALRFTDKRKTVFIKKNEI